MIDLAPEITKANLNREIRHNWTGSIDDNTAAMLRTIWGTAVDKNPENWKKSCSATVSNFNDAVTVFIAMNFMGATVDEVTDNGDGTHTLYSRGYYYHVGA